MHQSLTDVAKGATGQGLSLRRAWPRSPDHLLLDLVPDAGSAVAGQWLADADRAAQVAARTGPPASVHGAYAKVVRPERVADVAWTARAAMASGARVPEVLDVDEAAGIVTTAALPGRTLHDLLGDGSPDTVSAVRAVGRALAALHASPRPAGAGVHDGAAEQQVLQRWEELARACDVLPAVAALDGRLLDGAGPLVPVHRDLHDKQVLVDDGDVGLLDFDLAAAGEAALDLANLLVYLELRALQGVCSPELARAAADAVLDGYAPSPQVRARLPVYDDVARRRLVAVYGFRPASTAAARRLVEPTCPAA